MKKITHFTIYGERCSGTNYLENLILKNFNVELTWKYGHKHFFGFDDLRNSKNTLFICIVRNIHTWINSFFKEPHHLEYIQNEHRHKKKKNMFLNHEIISHKNIYINTDKHAEIMKDKNMYTGERYKNIFELRHTKIKWLLEDLPKKVDNYIFIRYEDLIDNFENTMKKIEKTGLKIKNPKSFPTNVYTYKKESKLFKPKKINVITKKDIFNHPDFNNYYENILNYI